MRNGCFEERDWGIALEVGDILADFGVRPVLCADELAPYDALPINEVGFGPHIGVVERRHTLIWIAHGDQIDVALLNEALVVTGVFVDADGEDNEVRVVVVQPEERWQLGDAGAALAPPEIEKHDFSAVIGQIDGGAAVADFEVGCKLTGLLGMVATIAAGQGHKSSKSNQRKPASKPHTPIIRTYGGFGETVVTDVRQEGQSVEGNARRYGHGRDK